MPNGVPMSWLRTSYDHPPLFVADGTGARFRDVDGHEYADFNIADMSMFTGYGPEPVVEAVTRRVAQGTQFLLPNEDSIWVAEELGRRYGLPKWQFTLARDAREHRGDPGRARADRPGEGPVLRRQVPRALRRGAGRAARTAGSCRRRPACRTTSRPRRKIVPFNDLEALRARARAARRRRRHHRAGADEQRRAAAAGRRLPRRAARDHPGDRHPAGVRRDAHPGRRSRRADADVGAASPTS